MSLKAQAFSTIFVAPQTTNNFWIDIQELDISSLLVEKTSIPIPSYEETQIWIDGQPFYIPTRKQMTGEWSCTFHESALMYVSVIIARFASKIAQTDISEVLKNGILPTNPANQLITEVTKPIFLKDINDELKSTTIFTPITISVYLLDRMTGDIPLKKSVLRYVWLKEVENVSLDQAGVQDPLKWTLKFRYNEIEG